MFICQDILLMNKTRNLTRNTILYNNSWTYITVQIWRSFNETSPFSGWTNYYSIWNDWYRPTTWYVNCITNCLIWNSKIKIVFECIMICAPVTGHENIKTHTTSVHSSLNCVTCADFQTIDRTTIRSLTVRTWYNWKSYLHQIVW